MLGLCYGAQLMMHVLGGKVERADVREYGKTEVLIDKTQSKIFADVSPKTVCWMSHFDYISQVAPGFEISSHTKDCPLCISRKTKKRNFMQYSSIQKYFTHRKEQRCLYNFVRGICQCSGEWRMDYL